jgi:hypothetical protein
VRNISTMNWTCAVCGASSRTNRRRCTKCGNMRWRPTAKTDIHELAGPMKRMVPRGLLLAKPGKQAPVPDLGAIECGTCHVVIYRAEGVFDAEDFEAARKKHYSVSPTCESHEQHSRR